MSISLINHVGGSGDSSGGTTSPGIDTSGANFIVLLCSSYAGTAPPAISDSKSNTPYVGLTLQDGNGLARAQLFYFLNPTVGSSHTFTVAGAASYSAICVAAFSGVATVSAFDLQNGSSASNVASIAAGSITPSENDELVIAGLSYHGPIASAPTIDGSFSITDHVAGVSGNNQGGVLAYLIQTAAAAANPTWSLPAGTYASAVIASFKKQASGGSIAPQAQMHYARMRGAA